MKRLLYVFLLIMFPFCLQAQMSDEYWPKIKQAEAFYNKQQYRESAEAYLAAFKTGSKWAVVSDVYNAARAMAQAGMADSAFSRLNLLANKTGYAEYDDLKGDSGLVVLHTDPRWNDLCQKVRENKEKKEKDEANLNKPLVALLDTVYTDDQEGRRKLDETTKKYGKDSKELKELWQSIKEKDSLNLVKVEKILDQYGWLGADVVGGSGNRTLFLVIQHADLKTQEKYLPMMREAVKNKKASASHLALLEDRVALGQGKKQIYGSQIGTSRSGEYYVQPLEDPDNVDKRRAEAGLGTMAAYVERWKIKWDPEAYKKQLPEIEKEAGDGSGK